MATPPPPPSLFDTTTLTSLASTCVLLAAALGLARLVLPQHTAPRLRALFVWHAFDALIHFILEGSFVYHCRMFVYYLIQSVVVYTPFQLSRSSRKLLPLEPHPLLPAKAYI